MGPASESTEKTVILNPVSGSGDHADGVRNRALLDGYRIEETEGDGDAIELAREAAERGATLIAAAGGDGTLNEVVRGVDGADALADTTVGVIPVGTGNNFATNVGITDIDQAFDVLANGPRRRIDLGVAGDTPFVNSCICGLTADASGETDHELKHRFGVVAYVINSLQSVDEFDGLRLSVDVRRGSGTDPVWTGDALLILVGNGRRFSVQGDTQAHMEDGLFDVAIVENAPKTDLVHDALIERLLGSDSEHTTRVFASSLELSVRDDHPTQFSLDGEIVRDTDLSLRVRENALTVPVGESYIPDPDYEDGSRRG